MMTFLKNLLCAYCEMNEKHTLMQLTQYDGYSEVIFNNKEDKVEKEDKEDLGQS